MDDEREPLLRLVVGKSVCSGEFPEADRLWQVKAEKTSGLLQEWQLAAYAVCANVGE